MTSQTDLAQCNVCDWIALQREKETDARNRVTLVNLESRHLSLYCQKGTRYAKSR